MIIKVSELQGAALDWAVAKCEGAYTASVDADIDGTKRINYGGMYPEWSTDWSQGGPIIEREGIFLAKSMLGGWTASIYTNDDRVRCTLLEGETPLIAAMRCLVAANLGDEIDLPADLALDCLIYETGDE